MAELRYNPLLRDWTMVAANRQGRPDMPKEGCPFCPGSSKVPAHYDVMAYPNDFPVLSPTPDELTVPPGSLYRAREAYGRCEVILYSSDHETALSRLDARGLRQVVALWAERYRDLSRDPRHAYILIFENRGREVGATISHPHGQIYAYPFLPIKIRTELESAAQHYEVTGRCLICDITETEVADGRRLLAQNGHFTAFIPYFTDFPYGAWIAPTRHLTDLSLLSPTAQADLAEMLGWVTRGLDALFQRDSPYMMVIHQTPPHRPDVTEYYHLHIEFYPLLRDHDRIKFLASSETGAGASANPAVVEETAAILRTAMARTGPPGTEA
jgi:UDPglucose--hexose-1-phosphate uridylyltransferase